MNSFLAIVFTAGFVFSSQAFAEEKFAHDWVESKNSHNIDVVYEGSSFFWGIDPWYTVEGEVDNCEFGPKQVQEGSSIFPCPGVKISLSTKKNVLSACNRFDFQNIYIEVGGVVFAKQVGSKHLGRDYIECPDRSKL